MAVSLFTNLSWTFPLSSPRVTVTVRTLSVSKVMSCWWKSEVTQPAHRAKGSWPGSTLTEKLYWNREGSWCQLLVFPFCMILSSFFFSLEPEINNPGAEELHSACAYGLQGNLFNLSATWGSRVSKQWSVFRHYPCTLFIASKIKVYDMVFLLVLYE